MKALCWNGVNQLSVEQVADPGILNPGDAIVKVTLSSVCGSDLHLIDGFVPGMRKGDIIGHEFTGEIVETGPEVKKHRKGDRVVVMPVIGCGECYYCSHGSWSLCDNSNPHGWLQEKIYGYAGSGVFGYSHVYGGYAGSHAQYIRVPYADHGAFKIPEELSDEQVIFLSDAFPTGYMAADMAGIKPGSVVAVWGCGGVGQMAIRSAWLLGAERVIAIDRLPDRLNMAARHGKAEVINYEETNVTEKLKEMTGGRGPDCCIDAVGMEAHTTGVEHYYDRIKQALRLESDRPAALRQALLACGKGGTVSVVGVYAGLIDKFPMGLIITKDLTLRSAQMHGQKYLPHLMELVRNGDIDPSYLLTHRHKLEAGAESYRMFKHKTDACMRAVFTPNS